MTLFVLEFGGLRKPFKSVDGTPNMFALLQAKILEKFPAVGLGALLIEITGGSVEDWYAVDNDVDLDDVGRGAGASASVCRCVGGGSFHDAHSMC
jgi:hypothetical protein